MISSASAARRFAIVFLVPVRLVVLVDRERRCYWYRAPRRRRGRPCVSVTSAHAEGLAIAGAGKDHILHMRAAQGLGALLAQHPASPRPECWTCRTQFGPTTTAISYPGIASSVRSQKLLKPRIWIFFSFSIFTPGRSARLQLKT